MVLDKYRFSIPSNDEFSVPQLRMMLNEVEMIVSREIHLEEWEALAE